MSINYCSTSIIGINQPCILKITKPCLVASTKQRDLEVNHERVTGSETVAEMCSLNMMLGYLIDALLSIRSVSTTSFKKNFFFFFSESPFLK